MTPSRYHERRWPATLAVLAVLTLQLVLPRQVTPGPWFLVPLLELGLLVPIVAVNPLHLTRETSGLRRLALLLVAALASVNVVHLGQLVVLLTAGGTANPKVLVEATLLIWTTNVVVTALSLWETDRGGPFARDPRHRPASDRPDLLFPQMTAVPGWDPTSWWPSFVDYLFVAFTAATTFGPADTLPLTARAKLIIGGTASVSLVTIGLVAARAVNVL